jgi:hypothetical protein
MLQVIEQRVDQRPFLEQLGPIGEFEIRRDNCRAVSQLWLTARICSRSPNEMVGTGERGIEALNRPSLLRKTSSAWFRSVMPWFVSSAYMSSSECQLLKAK